MGKMLTEMFDLNISDAVFSKNENTMLQTIDFSIRKKKQQTLADCVRYFCKINAVENDLTGICFGFDNVVLNEELSNAKVRYIAQELADAIDKNSVSRIKELKYEFGKDIEFATAKNFLNKKFKKHGSVKPAAKSPTTTASASSCLLRIRSVIQPTYATKNKTAKTMP